MPSKECLFFNEETYPCNHKCRKNCPNYTPVAVKSPNADKLTSKSMYKMSTMTSGRLLSDLFRREQYEFTSGEEGKVFSKARYDKGHYPFIARSTEFILQALASLTTHIGTYSDIRHTKFLDCGCGIGNVVLLACSAGFDAYGIEYDDKTIERGREILKLFSYNPKRLIQGDLLTYRSFHKYDVLYGYCPLSSTTLERKFEARLYKQMRNGTFVVGLHPSNAHKVAPKETAYFQRLKVYEQNFGVEIMEKVYHAKTGSSPAKTRGSS